MAEIRGTARADEESAQNNRKREERLSVRYAASRTKRGGKRFKRAKGSTKAPLGIIPRGLQAGQHPRSNREKEQKKMAEAKSVAHREGPGGEP